MKIRTKLAIAFLTITVVPITLIYMAIIGLNNYQARVFSETYGVSEDVDLFSGASRRRSIRYWSRIRGSSAMRRTWRI